MQVNRSRPLVVGLRCAFGSRLALIRLAARMLVQIEGLTLGGGCSLIRCFASDVSDVNDVSDVSDVSEFLTMAILCRTARPLADIVAALRSLQGRIGVEMSVLWMAESARDPAESAHRWPLLMNQRWASQTFVEAGEYAIVAAVDAGIESAESARSIARAYQRLLAEAPDPLWSCSPAGPRLWSCEAAGEHSRRFDACGVDVPDLYAVAADLLAFAGLAARLSDAPDLRDRIDRLVQTSPTDIHVPLHVVVRASATADERLLDWLTGVAQQIDAGMQVTQVIVREVGSTLILGDAYGHAAKAGRLPAIQRVHVSQAHGEPMSMLAVALEAGAVTRPGPS